MANTKKYDIAVKTGEYTDGQGNKKGRYENVGSVMQGDNGPFIILKRTFNPAGVPNPDNRDSLVLSLFEPKDSAGAQQDNFSTTPSRTATPPPAASKATDFSNDVPF